MKKIEDLLVGVPYVGDIHHTDWESHTAVAHPYEDSTLELDQAVGEPVASSPRLDFERLDVASSGRLRVLLDFDPGMEACFGYFVAGSGAA